MHDLIDGQKAVVVSVALFVRIPFAPVGTLAPVRLDLHPAPPSASYIHSRRPPRDNSAEASCGTD